MGFPVLSAPLSPFFYSMHPPLTFCTNVYSGESWAEIDETLQNSLPLVRKELSFLKSPQETLPLGLWLPAQAAKELTHAPEAQARFARWMEEEAYEVTSFNGFPYGGFHQGTIKEKVFLPDWTSPLRREYTQELFSLLHHLAPEGKAISVSSLPASHKHFQPNPKLLIQELHACGDFLISLYEKTGRLSCLALEPEPLGFFDNTEESLLFFERLFESHSHPDALRRHLGLTFDTCHLALQYENMADSLLKLEKAGLKVAKVQASNALRLPLPEWDTLALLRPYQEDNFLHQVSILLEEGPSPLLFLDLAHAFHWAKEQKAKGLSLGQEWRVHFHIPLNGSLPQGLADTSHELKEVIAYQKNHPLWTPHWESETYTWSLLDKQPSAGLEKALASELNWLYDAFESETP